jgi:thiol-disulfide isomerase/thioredoxin
MLTNGGFMNISKKFFNVFLVFYTISTINVQAHYIEPMLQVEELMLLDDFYKALGAQKPTVIKLYSKNCPHCKMFEKPFEEGAKKHKNVDFFSADGKKLNASTIVKEVTHNKIKIPGFPTILYIKDGAIVDYMIGGDPKKHTEKVESLIHGTKNSKKDTKKHKKETN